MPAALAAFHNTASKQLHPPPSADISSTNARERHILGSVRKTTRCQSKD